MSGRKACPTCGCAIIKDWCTRCPKDKIAIVSANRPAEDNPETWRKYLAGRLVYESGGSNIRKNDFLNRKFVECDSCANKPGSPSLCAGCLANRNTISSLRGE